MDQGNGQDDPRRQKIIQRLVDGFRRLEREGKIEAFAIGEDGQLILKIHPDRQPISLSLGYPEKTSAGASL